MTDEIGRVPDDSRFLTFADQLQSEITDAADKIRSETKGNLDTDLIEARRRSKGILKYLETSFPHHGDRSESENLRLLLIIALVQGIDSVEELIATGQYVKACPTIRQDYESVTRIRELRQRTGMIGTTPNVRNAPEGSQRFYGQLSKITHAQDPSLLLNFLRSWEREQQSVVVSHVPHFVQPLAAYLFYIHVWLVFEVTREALLLFADMYGHGSTLDQAVIEFDKVITLLEKTGVTFDVPPDQGATDGQRR